MLTPPLPARAHADDCASYTPTYADDRVMPTCPVCSQQVFVKADGDPNAVVSAHIEAGCPRVDTGARTKYPCSHRGCSKAELTPIRCTSCHENFCISHRLDADHQCPVAARNRARALASGDGPFRGRGLVENMRPTASTGALGGSGSGRSRLLDLVMGTADTQQKSETARTGSASSQGAPQGGDRRAIGAAPAMDLAVLKRKAKGSKRVPRNKRVFAAVRVPTRTKPLPVFFHTDWTVAKVLDVVADAAALTPSTWQSGGPVLRLFAADGSQLPLSAVAGEVVDSGAGLVLAETLSDGFGSESENSSCGSASASEASAMLTTSTAISVGGAC